MTEAADFASRILADAKAGRSLDFRAIPDEIHDLAGRAQTEADHVTLLQLFHIIMDSMESGGNVAPENLDSFREVRDKNYRLLLTREILIGENASVELAARVTAREIDAGRMKPDDSFRSTVEEALKQPYISIEELKKIELDRVQKASKTKGWRTWLGKW